MPKISYKTISTQYFYEIPKIKGSRFFATLFPVTTKEQAEEYIAQTKKQYHDATHNCSAYKVGVHLHADLFGTQFIDAAYKKANDDGEPSNTAGKPILSVLDGAGFQNTLCIVTRYFGGTLLGVGGLIHAYTQAARESLAHAPLVSQEFTAQITITYDHKQISIVQYIISKYEAKIIQEKYDEIITQTLEINFGNLEKCKKELRDLGTGKIAIGN